MTSLAPSYIASLNRLRCTIFQTAYNPSSIRTGAKYLRRRLRGPSMMKYYPEEVSLTKLLKGIPNGDPDWDFVDEKELQRIRDVDDRKKRGKGAPKKAKNKSESRRTQRRR